MVKNVISGLKQRNCSSAFALIKLFCAGADKHSILMSFSLVVEAISLWTINDVKSDNYDYVVTTEQGCFLTRLSTNTYVATQILLLMVVFSF